MRSYPAPRRAVVLSGAPGHRLAEADAAPTRSRRGADSHWREVERYTLAADQARLARNALARSGDTTARRGIA